MSLSLDEIAALLEQRSNLKRELASLQTERDGYEKNVDRVNSKIAPVVASLGKLEAKIQKALATGQGTAA